MQISIWEGGTPPQKKPNKQKKTKTPEHFCFTTFICFLMCSDQIMQSVSKNSNQAYSFVLWSL